MIKRILTILLLLPSIVFAAAAPAAKTAELNDSPAVLAGRFYASARAMNVLMAAHQNNTKNSLKYGSKSRIAAMFHTSMTSFLGLHSAQKELENAAAALPAAPSADSTAQALLALADQELAQAEMTGLETTALVDSASAVILEKEKTAPKSETMGTPSVSMLLEMLKADTHPIASARAVAAEKTKAVHP